MPDWSALGIDDLGALLAGGAPPRRAERLADGDGFERWRVPLPGTPMPDGRRNGKPRGAGTGWLRLLRWTDARLGDRVRARVTAPRSASPAERAWNLSCALRAAGVPCAEPMAVAADGAIAAKRSLYVTRELEGLLPLDAWLERFPSARDRRELAAALGSFVARLAASGVRVPRFAWSDVVAHEKSGGRAACALEAITDARDRAAVRGIPVSALPELALAEVADGALGDADAAAERVRLARALAASAPASARAASADARDLARFVRGALGASATRADRRALFGELRALAAAGAPRREVARDA